MQRANRCCRVIGVLFSLVLGSSSSPVLAATQGGVLQSERLNPPLVTGGCSVVQVSPQWKWAVFHWVGRLVGRRSAGTGPLMDYAAFPVDGDFRFSPHDRYVFYRNPVGRLRASRLETGDPPLRLTSFPVEDYATTHDGETVYLLDSSTTDRELWRVPSDGSTDPEAVRAPGTAGQVLAFETNLDDSLIVYRADQDIPDRFELFAIPAAGGTSTKLSSPGSTSSSVFRFVLSPDTATAVYAQYDSAQFTTDLYSVAIDGSGPPTRLTVNPVYGGVYELRFDPTGQRVLYRGSTGPLDPLLLYSVPIDGSLPPVGLHHPLPPCSSPCPDDLDFDFLPDGSGVVFRAEIDDTVVGLYYAPIDGSAPAVDLAPGQDARAFGIAAGGEWTVFREGSLLYSVPTSGSAAPILLADFPVFDFQTRPLSDYVAYRTDRVGFGREVLRIEVDGSQAPQLMTPGLPPGRDTEPGYVFSPDGSRLVYRADQTLDEHVEAFTSRIGKAGHRVGDPADGGTRVGN